MALMYRIVRVEEFALIEVKRLQVVSSHFEL